MPIRKVVRKVIKIQARKPKGKKVKFTFDAPGATRVSIAGDFNGWDSGSTLLKKGKKKIWEKDIALVPGRYEYKFVVDGSWVNDPNNNCSVWNSFGSQNSVLEI